MATFLSGGHSLFFREQAPPKGQTKYGFKSLKIVIVGAGIAGLTTALAFRNTGHDVTVLERYAGPQNIGGPIVITANAARVLFDLGLDEIWEEKSEKDVQKVNHRRYATGEVLASLDTKKADDAYGFPTLRFARFRLLCILEEVAKERGVKILYDHNVISVSYSVIPWVSCSNSFFIKDVDLIVGADGISSVIRQTIAMENPIKTASHRTTYNINIPRSMVADDPELVEFIKSTNFWLGPQRVLIALNMSDLDDKLNLSFGTHDEEGVEGEWFQQGDLELVRQKFADFDPRVLKLLDIAEAVEAECYICRLSDVSPLKEWSKEKVVMVGDACHAMLPLLAMGASQSIEDAKCLAMCIDKAYLKKRPLTEGLQIFEILRKPRTAFLVGRGREEAEKWYMGDGTEQRARDQRIKDTSFFFPPQNWDGKHIDNPPEGEGHLLGSVYDQGFNVIDHVSGSKSVC
ncbi:hypothetical protein BJ875DRAFT_402682 [Amylocarpus encephaloides]|uniref:FAD-binding domain-containing protein n=1 Tax=Amylocarpus encephaloides TaxID=45428 RepID=A0A9P8C4Z7_9HELO|nr:hypothetical protein BJ875DRAFT_402682 [Amylocarpus encephaloides]